MATRGTPEDKARRARDLSFEIEDGRHLPKWVIRDWLVLAVMVALTAGWSLAVYAWEPGLR